MHRFLHLTLSLLLAGAPLLAEPFPSPSEFLKMEVGADRVLADYRQIRSYFDALAKASPRVEVRTLGKSTLGEDLFMAVISSEGNLRRQQELRDIARRIADPRGLTDAEAETLVRDGKVVLLVTCNIHASEIGSSQMAMEWAHALATTGNADTLRRLENVILLLVPSLNPDGQLMEVDWYRRQLGTKYEGGRMPWLYHPYTGHDNNRDWFMLTQKETKALTRAVYHEWLPQVWLDEHQMGNAGPRMFVPPYSEPVDPDIHPLVWREVNLIGANMAFRLEQAGKAGIIYGYAFDAYWIGGTKNTAWWKNISGLLTEVASAQLATPVFVEPNELQGKAKGLIGYGPQSNFPNPWEGGWWRLRDIMDHQRIASDATLETCSERRADLLRNAIARARSAIALARPGESYRIPARQRDPASAMRLAALLREHRVDVLQHASGDLYVPLAQPYGRFVREMMGTQRYNEVRLVADKEPVRPYDVSSWSLPLMMGVAAEPAACPPDCTPWTGTTRPNVSAPVAALLPGNPETARAINAALRVRGSTAAQLRSAKTIEGRSWPAGTVFLEGAALDAAVEASWPGTEFIPLQAMPAEMTPLTPPRVALYKPYTASIDEGWTRWVLETYGFAPKSLENRAIKAGRLREICDVIVLPDMTRAAILGVQTPATLPAEEGSLRYRVELPPEYQGGIEREGVRALRDFVEQGGTLVGLSRACDFLIAEFNIPVRNALARHRNEFACPGALLRAHISQDHPVTYGLPPEMPLFQNEATGFETVVPGAEVQRSVLARYPRRAEDVLVSGWISGAELIANRSAAVACVLGRGKIVLLGFRPQHRAQTPATYPFLFNALYWSVEK